VLPREIRVRREELHRLLAPLAEPLGMRLRMAELPAPEQVEEGLLDFLT
jgi:hypothetical protein